MAKKIYVGVDNFTPSTLPSGYTQIEYIQSSGTQYINTSFIPNQDTRVVLDIEYTQAPAKEQGVFGARIAYGNNMYILWAHTSLGGWQDGFGNTLNYPVGSTISGRCTVDKNKNVTSVNGTQITSHTYTTVSPGCPMFLLAVNNNGSSLIGSYPTYAKIYSCRIYDNGTLVRNFIPAKNSAGTVGLYDLVNGVFYTNAGTGTFTAGPTHQSVARQVKKIYIGVEENIARKIRKGYIGIGGIARPFFGEGLDYYGTITPLLKAVSSLEATHVGNYALFGGGQYRNPSTGEYENQTDVTAYNTSLTRSAPTALSAAANLNAATHVGSYALFAFDKTVNAYNTALTRSTPTALGLERSSFAGAHLSNLAFFAGGSYEDEGGETYSNRVDVYNTSLTRSTGTTLSTGREALTGAHVGNYALFAGGYRSGFYKTVDAYSAANTRTAATQLSVARRHMGGTTVGNYALFGGGGISGDASQTAVDAYDTSLTKTTLSLHTAMNYVAATHVGNYALFHGAKNTGSGSYPEVSAFDTSLTLTVPPPMGEGKVQGAATHVGNYALFGGGYRWINNVINYYATVDAYTAN